MQKERAFSQHSDCARERRVNCFIHTADGNNFASSSVTLTQQERCGEKYKAGEIEGKWGRSTETEGDKRETKRDGGTERCKENYSLSVSSYQVHGTPDFLHFLLSGYSLFLLLFSCLKVELSRPKTCHISVPLMCSTVSDKETRWWRWWPQVICWRGEWEGLYI